MNFVNLLRINLCVALMLPMIRVVYGAEVNNPDFTKGEKLIVKHKKKKVLDRTLGPTGLWARMHSESMMSGATRDTRQFLISKVENGSPAAGKLDIGDVILGTDNTPFAMDARKAFAAAIQKAEESDGKLSLHIWRQGKIENVVLKLKVMGKFDPASPFDCPYTDAVIEQLASHTQKVALPSEQRTKTKTITTTFPSLYALGMLATGREDLMPRVKAFAHFSCLDPQTKKPLTFEVSSAGKRVWRTAYKLIFLSEYYMATGDEFVLPALKILATGAAMGQSGAGTYGHRFSTRQEDGSYHGPLAGYGAMNQAGISMMTGLLLAQKAGIKDPEITAAIKRGKRFLDFFVEHGCISYGDHWAGYDALDNNGTSGSSAIMYGLLGDQRGQRYWSSMSVASAPTGREEGHQGCYWTHLWDDLGAARGGTEALNASFLETRYERTLERSWSGQVIDQGNIGPTKYGSRGDVTGERLLLYTIGSKRLAIQGKDMKVSKPLTGKDLASCLAGGRLIYNPELRKSLSEKKIFEGLSHELTPIRMIMGKTLYDRKLNRVDTFINMLKADDRYTRYGACNALSQAGFNSPKAVDALVKLLKKDDDILFRYFAVDALASGKGQDYGLNGAAVSAVPALLELAGSPVPNDPRQHLHWQISEALFYYRNDLFKAYTATKKVDDDLLIKAVAQILKNENGRARSMVPLDQLTEKQLDSLWAPIFAAVRHRAPSGIMFSNAVRTKGLNLLAEHRIKEGVEYDLELAKTMLAAPGEELTEEQKWVPWFGETMLKGLHYYGKHAEPVINIVDQWPVLEGRGQKLKPQVDKLKNELPKAKEVPLKSIK